MAKKGTHARRSRVEPRHRNAVTTKAAGRARTASPLDVRYWVTEHPAEEALTELLARVDMLERAGEPLARSLLEVIVSTYHNAARELGHSPETATLPTGAERVVARMLGANIVAAFWHEAEFEPRTFLPPIATLGPPWAVLPDAVHVLDLPQERIEAALSQRQGSRGKDPLIHALSSTSWSSAELFQIQVASALATSRELGPAAVFDRWVLLTLFVSLTFARYGPSKKGARLAARDANRLLDALRPDLSRRMTRVPNQLFAIVTRFEELLEKARTVHGALRGSEATPPILAMARDWFGGRVDRRDLARWRDMSPRDIASEILRTETRLSSKALRDQLRLADKAKEIEDSWDAFHAYLLTVPEAPRSRILSFPGALLVPPPAGAVPA